MQRKSLVSQKTPKARTRRKKAVPFDRYALLPRALAGSSFVPVAGDRVYAWRVRAGDRPQWHTCKVMRVSPESVELWDETLEQWFCFDPRVITPPDIRMDVVIAKPATLCVPSVTDVSE